MSDTMGLIERNAVVCTGCWQVVAIDDVNNEERIVRYPGSPFEAKVRAFLAATRRRS